MLDPRPNIALQDLDESEVTFTAFTPFWYNLCAGTNTDLPPSQAILNVGDDDGDEVGAALQLSLAPSDSNRLDPYRRIA